MQTIARPITTQAASFSDACPRRTSGVHVPSSAVVRRSAGGIESEWRVALAKARDARTFEDAALSVLQPLVESVDSHVSTAFGSEARVLRAIMHVRPGAEYTRIAIHTPAGGEAAVAYTPSATTWRWISERARPVLIDVRVGMVEVLEGAGFEQVELRGANGSLWETRQSWLGRDATHVLALPLVARGESCGMVTIEIDAPEGIAASLLPIEVVDTYGTMIAAATPHLIELPVQRAVAEPDPLLPVIGASMHATVETLRIFAAQDETLLLAGPTGAGKSRLAQWVHSRSARASERFEVVHLASRPEALRMGELFGWKRGAFTGAVSDYLGALGRAQRGTLFLDEVDKLSLEDQAGLLRLLEDGRYRPLGDGAREIEADVRFVLGTNADLRSRVREGTFREDLYYRIHVLPVRVPPLAERRDEIAAWAEHMLVRRHAAAFPGGSATLDRDARALLESHAWPGNLRQLDNVVRRAHALLASEHTELSASLVMRARHVERALAFEGDAEARPVLDLLHATASAFVMAAERRGEDAPLDLDLADALRGFVLAAATQKKNGSLEEAFRLFGRASIVQHRNHVKAFRKELSRVDAVYEAFAGERSPFGALVASRGDAD